MNVEGSHLNFLPQDREVFSQARNKYKLRMEGKEDSVVEYHKKLKVVNAAAKAAAEKAKAKAKPKPKGKAAPHPPVPPRRLPEGDLLQHHLAPLTPPVATSGEATKLDVGRATFDHIADLATRGLCTATESRQYWHCEICGESIWQAEAKGSTHARSKVFSDPMRVDHVGDSSYLSVTEQVVTLVMYAVEDFDSCHACDIKSTVSFFLSRSFTELFVSKPRTSLCIQTMPLIEEHV